MADRRKLVQLSRRVKAAQARYRSLEKRAGAIESKRQMVQERASRAINLLYGKRTTAARKKSLEAAFVKANREVERLKKIEDKIYGFLKDQEEKIANLEDNMRKASKKNPGRRHLPKATAKQQRQYEHILKSERKMGRPIKTAKRIAAATVRKRKNTKAPSPAQIRARKAFARMAKERSRLAKAKRRNPNAAQTLKKAGRALKSAARETLNTGAHILSAGAKALNPTKRIKVRNSYIDLVIRGTAKKTRDGWKVGRKTIAQGRGTAKISSGYYLDKATGAVYAKRQRANPKRKRNLDHRDSSHQVAVSKHWRAGGLSQWQRAHHAGQSDLFSHGIKAKPKRNKSKKANPSAETTRKKFAGSVTGERDLFYPIGTPNEKLAKLGKLVSIKTEKGTIKPVAGEAWLVADSRGKLHIGSTTNKAIIDEIKRCYGKVSQVEYQDVKKHLGISKQTIFFHKVGEENGIRPTLYADGKGGLVFRGGAYRLTSRGLEN